MKAISIKLQLIIFLSGLALFWVVNNKDTAFLLAVLISVFLAVAFDSLLTYIRAKEIKISESSVISGLIIAYVLSGDNPWWVFAAAAIMAIGSKHFIRFRHKHIFNPAALGVFLTILIFQATTQWHETYLWYVFVPVGSYFIYKIRKVEVLVGYAIIALGLFGFQAIIQKTPLGNIFGYLSYFYIFIMLIEPKTTPLKPVAKYIFGGLCALLIFIFTQAGVRFDVEIFSLLIANASVPLLNNINR